MTTDYAPGGDPLTSTVTDTSGAGTSTIAATTDLLGRTTSYTQSVPGTGATLTTSTAYNALGQTVSAATTSSAGGPTSALGWTYLPDGRLNAVTLDGTTQATVGYDATTKDISGVTYATGSTLTLDGITKNETGAQVGQRWSIGTRTLTDTLTRSRAGRIVQAVTADTGDPGNTVDWSYSHDTAARLTQATLAARPKVATYGYQYAGSGGCGTDAGAGLNGSRTGTTVQIGGAPTKTTQYCTDNAARLTETRSSTGGTVTDPATVSYDSHGNATQLGNHKLDYDGANRVTGTRESSPTPTQALTYTRDPLGRVTLRHASVTTGGDTAGDTRYGYTGTDDSPDYQLTPTGTLLERYLPLPGGALLTKPLTGAGQPTWALPNLHGDTTATLTGTTLTAGHLYDPYGQPLNPNTALPNTNRAPTTRAGTATTDAWHGSSQRAYEHTGGLNLILMGARTYLPTLGQFTATDPIPGGNTTTYTYPQDPINSSDLSGEMLCTCDRAGGPASMYHISTPELPPQRSFWGGVADFAMKAWDNAFVRGIVVGIVTVSLCASVIGCLLVGAAIGAAAGASNWAINHRNGSLLTHTIRGGASGALGAGRGVLLARNLASWGVRRGLGGGIGRTFLGYQGKHATPKMVTFGYYLKARWVTRMRSR